MTRAYNRAADPAGTIVGGAEYVPILWGQDAIQAWGQKVAAAIAAGSKATLSSNEPDLSSQAYLDPATASQLHTENLNPLAGQVAIGSSTTANGQGQELLLGLDWLRQFFSDCKKQCHVDLVTFHWYGNDINDF